MTDTTAQNKKKRKSIFMLWNYAIPEKGSFFEDQTQCFAFFQKIRNKLINHVMQYVN
jgi:hypothetical protein